ncbi:MAG: hypothetical protein ACYTEG_17585 [Planctomycetota bacterium]
MRMVDEPPIAPPDRSRSRGRLKGSAYALLVLWILALLLVFGASWLLEAIWEWWTAPRP